MNVLNMVNPIAMTKRAFGLAGSAVGLVDTVARDTAHIVLSGLHRLGIPGEQRDATGQTDSAVATDITGTRSAAAVTDVDGAPKGPTIVPVEPHAPDEPPIDVVGQALAAEAALGDRDSPDGAGLAHEPRGASRDEEHGDAPLQRAEAEGIEEEVTAALEGDAEPEEHLTEPLIDPADAKALAAEMQTSTRAADPHKG